MQKFSLKNRDLYLNRIIAFQDTEMIKVITGIRRCGKSSLMKLMAQHLLETGITQDQILEMNFESMSFPDMDVRGFYEYVKARILPDQRMYLFFDEVQRIPSWENAVNSFRVDFDCDIYITGSNAYLLSSELSTYLSGRYVEIKVLPLSFREFLDFHGYTVTEKKSPTGALKRRITDQDGDIYDERELFNEYARFGGMPMLADVGLEIDRVTAALDGVYSADPVKDPAAVKYDTISYDDVLAQHLMVMDTTATSLSMDNHIPVLLFALKDPENIVRAVCGEKVGTIVKE